MWTGDLSSSARRHPVRRKDRDDFREGGLRQLVVRLCDHVGRVVRMTPTKLGKVAMVPTPQHLRVYIEFDADLDGDRWIVFQDPKVDTAGLHWLPKRLPPGTC